MPPRAASNVHCTSQTKEVVGTKNEVECDRSKGAKEHQDSQRSDQQHLLPKSPDTPQNPPWIYPHALTTKGEPEKKVRRESRLLRYRTRPMIALRGSSEWPVSLPSTPIFYLLARAPRPRSAVHDHSTQQRPIQRLVFDRYLSAKIGRDNEVVGWESSAMLRLKHTGCHLSSGVHPLPTQPVWRSPFPVISPPFRTIFAVQGFGDCANFATICAESKK